MDKLALIEALITALLGTICLLARSPLHASRANGRLIRLERLRRSRWQWFSMVVLMFLLRIQHVLPPKVEIVVALQFLIFLVLPIRGLIRRTGREIPSAAGHAFSPQCDLQRITCAAPQP